MLKMFHLLSLTLHFAQAASTIYTGFNHGAFWGEVGNPKKAADFEAGFRYAQNLSAPVPFNSARLFTCKQQGTLDDYSEAFDAAVETKTTLFLGMWMSPAKRGDSLDDIIKNEISALGKGFAKYGQALADLVVGLSVGSEDIYRWEDDKNAVGISAVDMSAAIKTVKDTIASSMFAMYMEGKPIGHVDTAKYSVVGGADFYGITVYPYWNKDPIANAKDSFKNTLDNVVSRAKDVPIWIAEVGWPYQGPPQGASQADEQSLQQFWTDVGCTILGKYTTFWFELINDAEAGQPDWGIIDANTHEPRINMSCPDVSKPSAPISPPSTLVASPVATPPASSEIPPSNSSAPSLIGFTSAASPIAGNKSTIHITVTSTKIVQPSSIPTISVEDDDIVVTTTMTSTVWVQPSSGSPKATSSSAPANTSDLALSQVTPTPSLTVLPLSNLPWCLTMADIDRNGQLLPIAGNPAGTNGKCAPAPPMTAAPSSIVFPIKTPWCITVADIDWNGQYLPVTGNAAGQGGKCSPAPTYTGLPYDSGQLSLPALPQTSVLRTTTSLLLGSCTINPSTSFSSCTPEAPVTSPSSSVPLSMTLASSTVPNSSAPSISEVLSLTLPSSFTSLRSNVSVSSSVATTITSTSQHPYCQRKSSSLNRPVSPSTPSPAVVSSSTTLPDFILVSESPVSRQRVEISRVKKRKWYGWW